MPSVEQVMNRVLVSNDWMGEVFERFLREQDVHGDFRRLLIAAGGKVVGDLAEDPRVTQAAAADCYGVNARFCQHLHGIGRLTNAAAAEIEAALGVITPIDPVW